MSSFVVAGITALSMIDYPDHLSAVVYCQGCPYRCEYCHNPHLINVNKGARSSWPKLEAFLSKRQGLLDAVVFSGGEPLLQTKLIDIVQKVKAMGFKVGLHTTGAYPKKFQRLLAHLDWVGMDLKAPFDDYESVSGAPKSGEKAKESAKLLINSGVDYAFRTTYHPLLLSEQQILQMANELAELGATCYHLQNFRPQGCDDSRLCEHPPATISTALCDKLTQQFQRFSVV
jgi:pyruvate formate lyase activating enzyme